MARTPKQHLSASNTLAELDRPAIYAGVPPVADTSDDLTDEEADPEYVRKNKGRKKKDISPVVQQQTDQSTAVPIEVEIVPEPIPEVIEKELVQSAYAHLTMMEKVDLMSNLKNVFTSPDVKNCITSKPSGDVVYEIFKKAMEEEISKIMDIAIPVSSKGLQQTFMRYYESMNQLNTMIAVLANQPLTGVLAQVVLNMGGELPIPKTMTEQAKQFKQSVQNKPIVKTQTVSTDSATQPGYNQLFD